MHLIASRTEIHATDNLSGTSLAGFVEREKLFTYKEIIVLAIENHELNGRENEVLF